jgi:hypothetical protein
MIVIKHAYAGQLNKNSFTHLRALLVLHNCGILAHAIISYPIIGQKRYYFYYYKLLAPYYQTGTGTLISMCAPAPQRSSSHLVQSAMAQSAFQLG